MAAGRIILPGLMPIEDENGDRRSGAKAYFYLNASTTLTQVYTDDTLAAALSNPVVADSVGVWPPMWASTDLAFNVSITDSDGLPIPNGAWSGLSPLIDATLAAVTLVEEMAAQVAEDTAEAAASAAVAAAAAGDSNTKGTSNTNNTIGLGPKTFVLLQTGLDFAIGMPVAAAITADGNKRMTGIVTAFADPSITINMTAIGTAGTASAWTLSQTSETGVTSVAGETGVVTSAELKAALALTAADVSGVVSVADAVAYAIAL